MSSVDDLNGKMPCYNCGIHCLNPCVAECDLGYGNGTQWYCRSCIEAIDVDDMEVNDSLIFCETEWNNQGK